MVGMKNRGVQATRQVASHVAIETQADREFVMIPLNEFSFRDWHDISLALREIADFGEKEYAPGEAGGTRMLRDVAKVKGWTTPEDHVLVALDTNREPGEKIAAENGLQVNLYSELPMTMPTVVNKQLLQAAQERATNYIIALTDKPALVLMETLAERDSGMVSATNIVDKTVVVQPGQNESDDESIEQPTVLERTHESGPSPIFDHRRDDQRREAAGQGPPVERQPREQRERHDPQSFDLTSHLDQLELDNALMLSRIQQLEHKNAQLVEEKSQYLEAEHRLQETWSQHAKLQNKGVKVASSDTRVPTLGRHQSTRIAAPTRLPQSPTTLEQGRLPVPQLPTITEEAYDEHTPDVYREHREVPTVESEHQRSTSGRETPLVYLGNQQIQAPERVPRPRRAVTIAPEVTSVPSAEGVNSLNVTAAYKEGRPRLFEPKHFGLQKWKPDSCDISTHLDIVAQCIAEARALGATESNLIRLLMRTLPEDFQFLTQVISKDKQLKYEDFALEVTETISSRPQEQISTFFSCTRKKGEYLLSYFYRLITLYKSSNCLKGDTWTSDSSHVMSILHKINEALYADVKHELARRMEKDIESGTLTIDKLKKHVAEIAKMAVMKQHLASETPRITAIAENNNIGTAPTFERGRSAPTGHSGPGAKESEKRGPFRPEGSGPKRACWHCNEEGHFRADCDKYKSALASQNGKNRGFSRTGNNWRSDRQRHGFSGQKFGPRENNARGYNRFQNNGNQSYGRKNFNRSYGTPSSGKTAEK